MAIDPFVIRSHRNMDRKRVACHSPHSGLGDEKSNSHSEDLIYGTQSSLKLVEPREHLGYFSTGYVIRAPLP